MNKTELIKSIAIGAGVSQVTASKMLASMQQHPLLGWLATVLVISESAL
jgi:hypothetical protein